MFEKCSFKPCIVVILINYFINYILIIDMDPNKHSNNLLGISLSESSLNIILSLNVLIYEVCRIVYSVLFNVLHNALMILQKQKGTCF